MKVVTRIKDLRRTHKRNMEESVMCVKKILSAAHAASITLLISTALLVSTPTYAATVNFHPTIPGTAVSIDNLEFGGQLWTINFVRDSYNDLTANGTDTSLFPTFGSESDSIALNDAINVELNNAGATSVGTISGSDNYGVAWRVFGGVTIDPRIDTRRSWFDMIEPDIWVTNTINQSYLLDQDNMFATASPVPIPAGVWLFGSGLIGLIGISRRKKAA